MRMCHILLGLVTLVSVGVGSGDATDTRLRIDVSPRISPAPGIVRVRAIVTPNAENRGLQIVADSGSFYRSSVVGLDGESAASVTEATFKNLPGGEYEIVVTLLTEDGVRKMDRRQIVVTSTGE